MNEKEKFQFNLMKHGMVTGRLTHMERFVLSMDFDEQQEDLLYDMLNKFWEMDNFTYHELEHEVNQLFGWNYQDVKGLIISLHDDKRYDSVVKNYLLSASQIGADLSIEYNRIADELGI